MSLQNLFFKILGMGILDLPEVLHVSLLLSGRTLKTFRRSYISYIDNNKDDVFRRYLTAPHYTPWKKIWINSKP